MSYDAYIHLMIDSDMKKKYVLHAKKAHDMDLSTWIRMLMHQDLLISHDE